MTVFLDTDVLVDCLRGIPAAQEWLERRQEERFQIHGVVAMELVVGSQDQKELSRTKALLDRFEVVWPDPSEFALAFDLLVKHRLASAIGIPDCLIAASALSRSCKLYTFNLKHFKTIDGLDVEEPYSR
jgi:tRNA(fMet)-specific endonuclease VapC